MWNIILEFSEVYQCGRDAHVVFLHHWFHSATAWCHGRLYRNYEIGGIIELMLQAKRGNGEKREVAGYAASMPPRVREHIQLYLKVGYVSRECIERPAAHVVRFLVVG